MSTSMGHDLERNAPEQQAADRSEQSPPDIYWQRIERLQAAADRSRMQREARKQRGNVA